MAHAAQKRAYRLGIRFVRLPLAAAALCCLVSLGSAQTGTCIGDIRMFAGNYAPTDWAICDGSLLQISDYTELYSLIGTTYGGDGKTTFALPDFRGRSPVGMGQGTGLSLYTIGQVGGQETVTLSASQIPAHTHSIALPADSLVGSTQQPAGNLPARNAAGIPSYGTSNNANLNGSVIGSTGATGGNQPVPIMPPHLCINFIIQTQGSYPTQN
jgi:microcystin-dependent protein